MGPGQGGEVAYGNEVRRGTREPSSPVTPQQAERPHLHLRLSILLSSPLQLGKTSPIFPTRHVLRNREPPVEVRAQKDEAGTKS